MNALNFARVIANDQLRIDLGHLLGNQPVLQGPLRVLLVAKGHRTQVQQTQTALPHSLNVALKSGRGSQDAKLTVGGDDIGFLGILETCASLSLTDPFGHPCQQHYTAGGTGQLLAAISATAPAADGSRIGFGEVTGRILPAR